MVEGSFPMFDGEHDVTVEVPVMGAENLMVPVIRAIVIRDEAPEAMLLQRRSDPTESVYGLLEIPGGRWRSGESPFEAIAREVLEESNVRVTSVAGVSVEEVDDRRSIATVRPLAVISGVHEAFPAIHVVVVATGKGTPAPADGEAHDVRWWPLEEVRGELARSPGSFVPSSRAAVAAYVGRVDALSG